MVKRHILIGDGGGGGGGGIRGSINRREMGWRQLQMQKCGHKHRGPLFHFLFL